MLRAASSTTFKALKDPVLRRVWLSSWLWWTGRLIEVTALPWLMLELTGSSALVALLGALGLAPRFLLAMAAGTLADRYPKRRLMMLTQVANLGIAAALLLLVVARIVRPWHLLAAGLLGGSAGALDFAARRPYLSERFGARLLHDTMTLDTVALTGSQLVGPLVTGFLIERVGYGSALGLMAAMSILAYVLLQGVDDSLPKRVKSPDLGSTGPSSAASVIASSRPVRAVVLATAILNLSAYPSMQLVPVVARKALSVGATLYGSLRAAKGLGALIGALLIASGRYRGKEVLFVCGTTLMLVGWLGFGLSGVYFVSLVLLLLAGIGESGFTSMQPTIILDAAPAKFHGQIMGAVSLAIGLSSLGALLTGQLAERIGAPASIVTVTAAGLLALTLPSYWLLRPGLRTPDRQTSG